MWLAVTIRVETWIFSGSPFSASRSRLAKNDKLFGELSGFGVWLNSGNGVAGLTKDFILRNLILRLAISDRWFETERLFVPA
jgi:hypothetical protein